MRKIFALLLFILCLSVGTSAQDSSLIAKYTITAAADPTCKRIGQLYTNSVSKKLRIVTVVSPCTWADTGGSGDTVGPASSTDNAIARFDSTTGKILQNSSATVDDNGSVNIPTGQAYKINGVALAKGDIGLGNVDNTSDANKPVSTAQQTALNLKENTANKDATGGYAGLTLFKINFKNAANTFTSFFTNSNTAARTYTFQNRDGTIADDTDLALKANLASPTFTTPNIGSATATTINGNTLTTGTWTLTGTAGKTLTFNNSLTLAGTDSTTMTFPSTSATIARTDAANTFTGTQTFSNQLIIPVGANNAPKIQFAGDTTSGIYSRTTGFFNLSFANANRFEVYASGVQLANNMALAWSSSTPDAAAVDAGITRTSAGLMEVNNGTAGAWRDLKVRQHYVDATMTTAGTTGAQTINKAAGSVNFAASATSLVVTNSLVTANSIVICTIQTNDSTATIKNCVPASGSFTITLSVAATAETKVAFLVINQ